MIDLRPTYPEPQYNSSEAVTEAMRASIKRVLVSVHRYHEDLVQYQVNMNQWRIDCKAELERDFFTD